MTYRSYDEHYVNRAMAAYFRGAKLDSMPLQPNSGISCIEVHDGKNYVVLRNINGVLAVYRITTSGQLKRLKRWPKEFEQ